MIQYELMALELQLKEERIAHWEKYHKISGQNGSVKYFDNQLAII